MMKVAPVGYLHERDGEISFTPIDVPSHLLSNPADVVSEMGAGGRSLWDRIRERLKAT
jgi:hypothetical protein